MIIKLSEAYALWHGFLQHIARTSRFTIGAKIDALFHETLEYLLLAGYASRDRKAELLKKASAKLDCLKFFLRLAWNAKALDYKKYAALIVPITAVGNMLGGWIRQLGNATPPDGSGGAPR